MIDALRRNVRLRGTGKSAGQSAGKVPMRWRRGLPGLSYTSRIKSYRNKVKFGVYAAGVKRFGL
jgi:hypothetical protein